MHAEVQVGHTVPTALCISAVGAQQGLAAPKGMGRCGW